MIKRIFEYFLSGATLILCLMMFSGCRGIPRETDVFNSDFEHGVPVNVIEGKVEQYNGTGVLGRYSQDGFTVEVRGMKPHNMIRISFDLYIHDSWDGNAAGPDGKDIWIMNVDGGSVIYASFANGACSSCTQSYPELQPPFYNGTFNFARNRPNSNAIKTDLPGACKLKDVKGGTSMYRIQRTFQHTGSTLDVGCFAGLEDADKANKNCNESWSVDNMRITAIETSE